MWKDLLMWQPLVVMDLLAAIGVSYVGCGVQLWCCDGCR
jgi:hypothetical protein